MKKAVLALVFLSMGIAACGPAPTPAPTETQAPTAVPTNTQTPTALPTVTATLTQTPAYPPEGLGPDNFPTDVDPLTGLKASNPALLERRPMVIKVSNLPRDVRPQWGLSLADIVFEYYTEEGSTRFAAVFYGNDAETVGPVRSGRFIDTDIVRGYKAVFAFGYAYIAEWEQFKNSEFADRLVVEGPSTPFKRYDPNSYNYLIIGTAALSQYATQMNMQNVRQDLNGMTFKLEAPVGGQPATQAVVRYSASIYNRWDYDAASGKYLRFSDTADVFNSGETEQYAQLTDRLNGQPITADNVVVLYVNHELYSPNIYDIRFSGSGKGYALRDGQVYEVNWQRGNKDVVSLTNPDGSAFAFKPGITWFEVVGLNSTIQQTSPSWRFTHIMP